MGIGAGTDVPGEPAPSQVLRHLGNEDRQEAPRAPREPQTEPPGPGTQPKGPPQKEAQVHQSRSPWSTPRREEKNPETKPGEGEHPGCSFPPSPRFQGGRQPRALPMSSVPRSTPMVPQGQVAFDAAADPGFLHWSQFRTAQAWVLPPLFLLPRRPPCPGRPLPGREDGTLSPRLGSAPLCPHQCHGI